MKKLILAATALSLVAAPAMAAPARHGAPARTTHTTVVKQPSRTTVVKRTTYRAPTVRYQSHTAQQRHWVRGQRFDYRYAPKYRQIDYRQYRGRGLYAPPRGYQWVQSGNDAVLVAVAGGLMGAILGGALN